MAPMCKFSIVTPSYNQAQFIAETIESVLSQAGDFEIEYFVMDGGSTDGSAEIIKDYAERIRSGAWPIQCSGITMEWVSQRDKGQSDAINQGLRRTTGAIASYINSDDLFFPGAFARVAQEFAAYPTADFVYGDGDVIDADGHRQWEWLSRPYNHKVMTSYHFLWNDFTNYLMQQSTFWRTQVHDQIGYFDEEFHYAMDAEYWIRAGAAGMQLRHIPCKLGKFRLIQGTKSLSSPTAFWADQLEIFRRYRGSYSLGRFFAYYYFNLARQYQFDLTKTRSEGEQVFARWHKLPSGEQQAIARQADYGYRLACFLIASELYRNHQDAQAAVAFHAGAAQRPWLAAHYLAIGYLVRRAVGHQYATRLDTLIQARIARYRQKHVDYRYHTTGEGF